jgi:hypothetical protein
MHGVFLFGVIGAFLVWSISKKAYLSNLATYFLGCFLALLVNNFSQTISYICVFFITISPLFEYDFDRKETSKKLFSQFLKILALYFLTILGFIRYISTDKALQVMFNFYDHISHFGMLRNIAETNKVYDFFPSALNSGWLHYPQAWHTTIFTMLGSPLLSRTEFAIPIYALSSIATFFLLITVIFTKLKMSNFRYNRIKFVKASIFYIAESFILMTLLIYVVMGAYVNFAFAIVIMIIAVSDLGKVKQTTLLMMASALVYTNFIIYFATYVGYLALIDLRMGKKLRDKTVKVIVSFLFVFFYIIIGTFMTNQIRGVGTGVELTLESVKYTILCTITVTLLVVLRLKAQISADKKVDFTLWNAAIITASSIGYIIFTGEVNYFLQKMLIASSLLALVGSQQNWIFMLEPKFNKSKAWAKRKPVKYESFTKNKYVNAKHLFIIALLISIVLTPQRFNSAKDLLNSLTRETQISDLNLVKFSVSGDYSSERLLVFLDERNGDYQSYLVNQWLAVLSGTFTDKKQILIESCLRDVELILTSEQALKNINSRAGLYEISGEKCV